MTRLPLPPSSSIHSTSTQIGAYRGFPNTSLQHHPLTIYRGVFPDASADAIEEHLMSVGVVKPHWRFTMHETMHYHSTAHEILVVSQGRALICFGGDTNPEKVETEVKKGDVMAIPAGVGHRLVEDKEGDFEMVGSYPKGQGEWDMCYGWSGEREMKWKNIEDLVWPKKSALGLDRASPAPTPD